MPTGYTAGIVDGTITNFTDYARQCARAFGALITERDSPITPEIPILEVGQYYLDRVKKAKAELNRLRSITSVKAEKEFNTERNRNIKYHEKSIKEREDTNSRYLKILEKCKKFKPPTEEHINYGAFLVSQIESSIPFDCDTSWHQEQLKKINRSKSWERWLKNKIKSAKRDLEYAEKSLKEEICRVNSRNQWLSQLKEAIKEAENV